MTGESSGRRIVVVVGLVVVALAGGVGFVVGENAAEAGETVQILGSLSVPASGPALGAFGGLLAATLLGGLFALVELASRLEGTDPTDVE